MMNLFISMPMRGKTHKEIIHTRYRAIARVKSRFPNEDITGTHTDPYHYKIIFNTSFPVDIETRN